MSDNGFTRNRLAWLDAVMRDSNVTHFAFRVAYIISSFVNRERGYAWPGQATIAGLLTSTKRGVKKAIDNLVQHGYLAIEAGGGRGLTNRYRMDLEKVNSGSPFIAEKDEQRFALSESKKVNSGSRKDEQRFQKKMNGGSPDLSEIELSEDLSETILSEPADMFGQKKKSAKKARKQRPANLDPAAFEQWWNAYPRKVEPKAARIAYAKVIAANEATAEELLAGAERYAHEKANTEARYIKHPAVWLHKGCWADEPAPIESRQASPANVAQSSSRRWLERQLEEGNSQE